MREITVDVEAIAYCGLYCGACKAYLKEKCPGCHDNVKAGWCKVRKCNMEHDFKSCADCTIVENRADCKMLNNFIAKLFSLVFRSDRPASLTFIAEKGYDAFAQEMTARKAMSFKR